MSPWSWQAKRDCQQSRNWVYINISTWVLFGFLDSGALWQLSLTAKPSQVPFTELEFGLGALTHSLFTSRSAAEWSNKSPPVCSPSPDARKSVGQSEEPVHKHDTTGFTPANVRRIRQDFTATTKLGFLESTWPRSSWVRFYIESDKKMSVFANIFTHSNCSWVIHSVHQSPGCTIELYSKVIIHSIRFQNILHPRPIGIKVKQFWFNILNLNVEGLKKC